MRIRGHHLLCLLAFRGKGYDPVFTEVLHHVIFALSLNPEMIIEIGKEADIVCGACPKRSKDQCLSEGINHPVIMDQAILICLDINPGDRLTWKSLKARIRKIGVENLVFRVCSGCSWLETENCLEKIKETLESEA